MGAGILGFPAPFVPSNQSSSCQEQSSSRALASWINPVKQFTDLTPDAPFETWGYGLQVKRESHIAFSGSLPGRAEGPGNRDGGQGSVPATSLAGFMLTASSSAFLRLMCRKETDMKGRGCPSPPSWAPSSQTLAGNSPKYSHHSTRAGVGEGVGPSGCGPRAACPGLTQSAGLKLCRTRSCTPRKS